MATVCSECTCLTSLRVQLRSGAVVQPFDALFPGGGSARKALASLSHLKLLVLDNIALWLHELTVLMLSWPELQALAVSCLRGDCVRSSSTSTDVLPCRLRNLRVEQSTLTNEMTAHLLRDQSNLRFLSLPVQGLTGRTLAELEKVMPNLTTLDVRDSWASSKLRARSKTPKKNDDKVAEMDKDDLEQDEVTLPLPSLFRLLKSTACPDTVHLNRTLAPSDFFEEKGISQLTACMVEVENLSLDDFPPTSSIYGALAAALKADDLPFLKSIIVTSSTSATSSAKKTTQSKGLKALEAVAKARGVTVNSS